LQKEDLQNGSKNRHLWAVEAVAVPTPKTLMAVAELARSLNKASIQRKHRKQVALSPVF
jgi:hypothetical protein